MKCTLHGCPGEYETRRIVHAERHGDRIIVIDGVPAEVCRTCGDVLLTLDTVRRLERIATHGESNRVAPVYEFA